MDLISTFGFDVPPGKNLEFQTWVRANAAALSEHAPEGTELVGIYATMFGSEKHSGTIKIIWRKDSYGAMDRFAAAAGEESEFARLLDELLSFMDVRPEADWSKELLKSVADITISADIPEE